MLGPSSVHKRHMAQTPECRFYRFYQQGRAPIRADRFAGGTLPIRAARYCDAITTASGFGWWLFPPVETFLLWDGRIILWSTDGDEWSPVDDAVHFPGFPEQFDEQAPDILRGAAHPYLTALPEPGLIQLSLGILARTAEDWCLLVRRPANFPLPGHVEHFEGIIAPDRRIGHVFTNLRLTKTDFPIRLRIDIPLVQVQPIPRFLLAASVLADMTVEDSLGATEWDDYYHSIAEPNMRPNRPFGAYAAAERRARRGTG
jgi:hypothetical protein